jgi:DUF4097 and DUF4098 domain-containing protein YvlB
MMSKSASALAWTIALSLDLCAAQDFQRSYELSPGGQILIANISGKISVKGYKGNAIEITAIKRGSQAESIEIVDRSFGNRIDIHARFPRFATSGASVDFEVQVPSSVAFNFSRIRSFNGNVEVADVRGRIMAESVRGNVEIKNVSGLVNASSMSGNVNAGLEQVVGKSNMNFSSISGNISVSAPANLGALVDMSSASGILRTDFPIEIQERRYGPGRSARGRLGSGQVMLRITSVSGNVSLLQK